MTRIRLIEDVRLVAVYEDATVGCVLGQEIVQPHLRVCRFAEPTSVRVAIETVDGNDTMKLKLARFLAWP